jgi:hypothetical protein
MSIVGMVQSALKLSPARLEHVIGSVSKTANARVMVIAAALAYFPLAQPSAACPDRNLWLTVRWASRAPRLWIAAAALRVCRRCPPAETNSGLCPAAIAAEVVSRTSTAAHRAGALAASEASRWAAVIAVVSRMQIAAPGTYALRALGEILVTLAAQRWPACSRKFARRRSRAATKMLARLDDRVGDLSAGARICLGLRKFGARVVLSCA